MKLKWVSIINILILVTFVPVTSFRTFYKIFPHPFMISIIFSAGWGFAATVFLHTRILERFRRYIDTPIPAIVLIIATIIARCLLYPLVNGIGVGATGDDAFFLPISRMLHFQLPYELTLHDGAPISPGMGWLFMNLPFGSAFLFPFFIPAYMLFSAQALYHFSKSWPLTNLTLFCMTSTTIFWTLLGSGHDLVAVALSLLIAFILVERTIDTSNQMYIAAVIVGGISTSRVIFIILPLLFSILHIRYRRRRAIVFGAISLSVAALFHLLGFLISSWYQPLHLIQRGLNNVGVDLMVIGAIGLLIYVCIVYHRVTDHYASRRNIYAFTLGALLAVIAAGELRAVNFNISLWEGLSYLYVATPMVVWTILDARHGSNTSHAINGKYFE